MRAGELLDQYRRPTVRIPEVVLELVGEALCEVKIVADLCQVLRYSVGVRFHDGNHAILRGIDGFGWPIGPVGFVKVNPLGRSRVRGLLNDLWQRESCPLGAANLPWQ